MIKIKPRFKMSENEERYYEILEGYFKNLDGIMMNNEKIIISDNEKMEYLRKNVLRQINLLETMTQGLEKFRASCSVFFATKMRRVLALSSSRAENLLFTCNRYKNLTPEEKGYRRYFCEKLNDYIMNVRRIVDLFKISNRNLINQ